MSKKTLALIFSLFIAVSTAFAILIVTKFGLFELLQLKMHGIRADATVVRLYDDYHKSFDYEFEIGSHKYSSASSGRRLKIKVGDRIPVTYLETNPAVSTYENVDALLTNNLFFLLGSLVILAPFTVCILLVFWMHSKRQAKKSSIIQS